MVHTNLCKLSNSLTMFSKYACFAEEKYLYLVYTSFTTRQCSTAIVKECLQVRSSTHLIFYSYFHIFSPFTNVVLLVDIALKTYLFSSKICYMPLCFYGRPKLVSVSAKQKKSREDYCFYRKVKTVFNTV